MLEEKQNTSGRLAIADNLVAVAKADTLYCDLYLLRAGYYLQPEMTKENYRNLKQEQIILTNLPSQTRNAMGENNWAKVRELSGHFKTLKEALEKNSRTRTWPKSSTNVSKYSSIPSLPACTLLQGFPWTALPNFATQPCRDCGTCRVPMGSGKTSTNDVSRYYPPWWRS